MAVADLAHMLGEAAGIWMGTLPIPDTMLRLAGAVLDRAETFLPVETPFTAAGMQYYTQMPESDDSPSVRDLGIHYRSPAETVADTVAALR